MKKIFVTTVAILAITGSAIACGNPKCGQKSSGPEATVIGPTSEVVIAEKANTAPAPPAPCDCADCKDKDGNCQDALHKDSATPCPGDCAGKSDEIQ